MSEESLVSIPETRKILGGIGRTKTYQLLESDLETVKLGSRRLVIRSSIDRLVERLRHDGVDEVNVEQGGEDDARASN